MAKKINPGDIVECIPHPKYNTKEFKGQAEVIKVLAQPSDYLWVDWHYGFGMIMKSEVKLADDQTKCIVSDQKYIRKI